MPRRSLRLRALATPLTFVSALATLSSARAETPPTTETPETPAPVVEADAAADAEAPPAAETPAPMAPEPAPVAPEPPDPVLPPAIRTPLDPPAKAPTPATPLGLELTFNSEVQGFAASRMGAFTTSDNAAMISFRAAWKPLPRLAVYAGIRGMPGISTSNAAYSATTSALGGLVGARFAEPLLSWLDLVAELDLEALSAETELEVGGLRGEDGGWAFGAVPRIGLGANIAWTETVSAHVRVMFGYALRTDHALDALTLDPAHDGTTAPLALGALNLSGPVFTFSLGLSF
jgi:hypothetical protein